MGRSTSAAAAASRKTREHRSQLVGVAGDGQQPRPHVLAALGVVRREGGHPQRPVLLLGGGPLVQGGRAGGVEHAGVAADLVQGDQAVPAVEGGVLDALGHHRSPGLLQPDREVDRRRVLLALDLRQAHQQLELGLEVEAGGHGTDEGVLDPLARQGGQPLVGVDVGAVDLAGDEQLDDGLAQPLGVLLGQRLAGPAGEPLDLRAERLVDDLALGRVDRPLDVGLAARLGPGPVEDRRGGRVDQRGLDRLHRVVPGGAVAGPGGGQPLGALEDLLDPDQRAGHGGLAQLGEVALGVGQAVGVVDPEAVDDAVVVERQQHPVGGLEHVRELDPHRDQLVDLEEAPVVEHRVGLAPAGQLVVLAGQHLGDVVALGAQRHRVDVLEVADHGLAVELVQDQVARLQGLGERAAEHREPEPAAAGLPVDVEPVRGGGVAALAQHGPQRGVGGLGRHQRHVVGHDVDDEAQVELAGGRGQGAQALLTAEVLRDPGVVQHVVPVHGAGDGLQDR